MSFFERKVFENAYGSESFFFDFHFLRFLVAIEHLPPYRGRGPIATESLIYVFSDFEMSLFL